MNRVPWSPGKKYLSPGKHLEVHFEKLLDTLVYCMGKTVLKKHMLTKKHKDYVLARETTPSALFFSRISSSGTQAQNNGIETTAGSSGVSCTNNDISNAVIPSNITATSSNNSNTNEHNQLTIEVMSKYMSKDNTIASEVLFALNSVVQHVSLRISESYVKLSKRCFPDSEVAQTMSLGKDKTGYTITPGISEYFNHELMSNIMKADLYVILFDESLNDIAQKFQMDVYVRFIQDDNVQIHYLSTKFL